MLLRRLEYLLALAREKHFARAATACGVTQPALSAGIRKLEQELGVQIVRRGQRFGGFTPEGEEVLRWAQRILAEHADMTHALSTMHGGLSGTLRIGAIPTALPVVAALTAAMIAEHPDVQFSIRSMSSREIVRALNDFDVDVGLTYVDGEPLGKARVVPLYRERYLFVAPAQKDFHERTTMAWADAAREPLCLLTPDMQNRRIIDGHFAHAGAEAHAVVETDTVSVLYSHLTELGLCSVIPHTWFHRLGQPAGTHVIAMEEPGRDFHVGLVLPPRKPGSILSQAFVAAASSVELGDDS